MRQPTRAWSSPIESAVTRPRHRFGIDRHVIVFFIPGVVALLFTHGWQQVITAVVLLIMYTAAKVQWELNPYLFTDLQIELASPKAMTDDR